MFKASKVVLFCIKSAWFCDLTSLKLAPLSTPFSSCISAPIENLLFVLEKLKSKWFCTFKPIVLLSYFLSLSYLFTFTLLKFKLLSKFIKSLGL